MRVYEYAKENDMTNDDVKGKFGLDHHMDLIPESEPVAPSITVAEARATRNKAGDKDLAFLRLVKANKDAIPEEYERLKGHIEKYL